jgi:O-antigen ligase
MHSGHGRTLAAAAYATLAVSVPVVMVFANRASPALITLAALLAAAAALADGGWTRLASELSTLLWTREAFAGSVFMAWALASVAWSGDVRQGLSAWAELALVLGAAALLAATLPSRAPAWAFEALAIGLIVSTALLVVELRLDFPIRRLWNGRLGSWVLNRPVVTDLAFVWPLVGAATAAAGSAPRRWAIVASAGVVVAIALSSSGAAKLGLIVGVIAYGAAILALRLMRWAFGAVVVVLLIIQPVFGPVADALIPPRVFDMLKAAHARERADIWLTFSEVAGQRLWTGTGFQSSANLSDHPVAALVSPERREMLAVGHPHNALLQLWVELGLPGVLAMGAIVCLAWRQLFRVGDAQLPARLAFAFGLLAIAVISHGAWQGWWAAAIGGGLVLFACLDRTPETG